MLPDDLLDLDDLNRFLEKETELARKSINDDSRTRLHGLQKKAAWLMLEELFLTHLELDRLEVRVGSQMMDHELDVKAFDEDGHQTEALDRMASNYSLHLNELARDPLLPFFLSLESLSLSRDSLEDCASKLFGEAWTAARAAKVLEHELQATDKIKSTPRI